MAPPSPSATVMLLRDQQHGPEALLLLRNKNLRTGAGAWVFPGGRVDPKDHTKRGDPFLAAQNAALRETFEETGIRLKRQALVPFAHWTTPAGEDRRFATWFFIAHLPDKARVQVDGGEIVDHRWLPPDTALHRQSLGEIELMAPTFVSLSWLCGFQNCLAVLDAFRSRQVQFFNPVICKTDTGRVILYDDDAGYRIRDPHAPGPRHRIFIEGGRWRYEESRQQP